MLLYQLTKHRKSLDEVSDLQDVDFAYAVFKNKQLIDNKLTDVDFIKNVSPQVIEYEEKRVKMCENYAQKDNDGNPIIEQDVYVITNKDEFKTQMDELLNQYRPFIEERQQQIELFNQKMNEPVELPFVKVNKNSIPRQIATANELDKISFMID